MIVASESRRCSAMRASRSSSLIVEPASTTRSRSPLSITHSSSTLPRLALASSAMLWCFVVSTTTKRLPESLTIHSTCSAELVS